MYREHLIVSGTYQIAKYILVTIGVVRDRGPTIME